MMTAATSSAAPPSSAARRGLLLAALAAVLTLALLLLLALLLDRPPSAPQITFIGAGEALNVLAEGAGGGRVLIGGGANGSELPAALGWQFVPWRRGVDLLIVADRRDLTGATELVRRGDVREVLTVGLDNDRAAVAALTALRDECAARGVGIRASVEAERITIGRGDELAIDIIPATVGGDEPRLRLHAGSLSAAIILGPAAPAPALAAIVPRGGQEVYRTAAAATPRLLIAPAPHPALDPFPADGQLLIVMPGQRATIGIAESALRLRGGRLITLDTALANR